MAQWWDTVTISMTFEKDVELHFFEDVDDSGEGCGVWTVLRKDLEKLP